MQKKNLLFTYTNQPHVFIVCAKKRQLYIYIEYIIENHQFYVPPLTPSVALRSDSVCNVPEIQCPLCLSLCVYECECMSECMLRVPRNRIGSMESKCKLRGRLQCYSFFSIHERLTQSI